MPLTATLLYKDFHLKPFLCLFNLFYTMILFFNFEKSAHFEKCSLILLHSCNIKNLKLFPKSPIFPNYSPPRLAHNVKIFTPDRT